MTEALRTEIAVLGAGPGGYAAAFYAADLGKDVILIDLEPNPGGVCLYRGCIPSKALLHAAETIHAAAAAKMFGIAFGEPTIDLDTLRDWRRNVVEQLTSGLGQLSKRRNITYLQGRGRFLDNQRIEVQTDDGNSRIVAYEHAILATGSSPTFPPTLSTEGANVWSSTEALELQSIPKNFLVVGGGYIGLEMATVYAALGSTVHVVEMTDGLLPGADRDLVKVLQKSLTKQGIEIRLQTAVEELRSGDKGVTATIRNDDSYKQQTYDAVLIATGRKPNTADLGLEHTGVRLDERGFIDVDAQRRTSDPTIFAVGDITGQPMLAHKASHEGRVAVEAACDKPTAYEPAAIPAVVFTQPELAWTGLTEATAKAEGIAVEIGKFPWGASGRAKTLGDVDGLTKLLFDAETHQLLGCGIVGPGAGELIAEANLAIEMGSNAHDLALTIHAHPTLSETLMEGAESIYGAATHIFRPRR